eukprot:scaffold127620_cov15-Tisochrysis_lutea.AAC.1
MAHPSYGLMMIDFRPVDCYTQEPIQFIPGAHLRNSFCLYFERCIGVNHDCDLQCLSLSSFVVKNQAASSAGSCTARWLERGGLGLLLERYPLIQTRAKTHDLHKDLVAFKPLCGSAGKLTVCPQVEERSNISDVELDRRPYKFHASVLWTNYSQ